MKKLIVLVMIMTLGLCGCSNSSDDKEKYNISFLVAANQNQIIHSFELSNEDLIQTGKNGGTISIVNCDSNPSLYGEIDIKTPNDNLGERRIERQAKEYALKIEENLENVLADDKEIDLLNSIEMCANALSENKGKKILHIYSSGLSTCASLNMSKLNNLQTINIDDTIAKLKSANLLPDLSSVTVKWFSLGSVGDNQKLSKKDIDILEKFWTTFLKESGAKDVIFNKKPSTSNKCYKNVPEVSLINGGIDEYIICENNNDIDLSGEQIYQFMFEKNVDILINKDKTVQELTNLAKYLNENQDLKISIFGCTAKYSTLDFCYKLSQQRCQTVCDILYELNVPQKNIVTVKGIAYLSPFHQDETKGGKVEFDEEIAKNNRCCLIVNSDSEIAKILSNL